MIKIRKDVFCTLSRNGDWREWLKENVPSLSEYLEAGLKKSAGCRDNKRIMSSIYNSLYESKNADLISKFEKLIIDRFPYALRDKSIKKIPTKKIPNNQIDRIAKGDEYNNLNKHGEFEVYRPHIMTIPHKLILADKDPIRLKKSIDKFLSDKGSKDYVIVEDRAYIEYMPIAENIPDECWEVKAYKNQR